MIKQTQLRTRRICPSRNISFPVGTIFTVWEYYSKLWFKPAFGRYKTKGRYLNSLVQALVSYKLTEKFSITKGCDWCRALLRVPGFRPRREG